MHDEVTDQTFGHDNVLSLARMPPDGQRTTISVLGFTSRNDASARVIQTLTPVPVHDHENCDE